MRSSEVCTFSLLIGVVLSKLLTLENWLVTVLSGQSLEFWSVRLLQPVICSQYSAWYWCHGRILQHDEHKAASKPSDLVRQIWLECLLFLPRRSKIKSSDTCHWNQSRSSGLWIASIYILLILSWRRFLLTRLDLSLFFSKISFAFSFSLVI
jgi:hypothetical protein